MIPSTRAPRPIVLSWSHDLVPLFLRVQLARAPLPSLLTWHSSVLPLHPAGGSLRFARRAVRTAPSHLLARWATRPLVAEQHTDFRLIRLAEHRRHGCLLHSSHLAARSSHLSVLWLEWPSGLLGRRASTLLSSRRNGFLEVLGLLSGLNAQL